ncbi:hypothetical protein K431DRAFT_64651 [Polychaeton citri CBS 116435]|uniref:Cation/H+ exchanger transmembrane domain-containing protein n=1 Tax=Polychaeton citri CBS 116435 TaxID=1314669 RepID=A0A9P4Q746_9PEZI|nr:hypothetical protein K431DRAFT_64651 [Polychaeton citri CBS 116435]
MATVTQFVTNVVTTTVSSASATSTARAPHQGGILEGQDPSVYDPKNPIVLFIIQASIIIILCRLLQYPLSLIRQPRVIAEVIGGIVLGPSIMGRIPGFTNTIFPKAAMPNLSLVANLGLVLFLFLVGLEVDLRYLVRNWKIALSVGLAGMALPFGLGVAIAWGLYHQFSDEEGLLPIAFGTYALFIGVAMAITAFPVLCRILTELKLLSTDVGIIVLSAGVGNDVVGWILLALCVALVNTGSGLTALWVLLTCVGYTLFLVYAVKPAFMWVLRRSGALTDGPSQSIIALTLMIALASAFFTGAIGVHAIFGAFMAGLICPHEGGFALKVTEKVEDLVSALFLPLYFALSGLSTNLGLLDDGITWAYVVGVIAVAFCGKFIGATLAARLSGLVWRESFTIGSLMSCKGLVELIVLNIGLQAKILSTRTFTIFVVMALVTTFATTPLTRALYPEWYQKKLAAWKRGEIDWNTGEPLHGSIDVSTDDVALSKAGSVRVRSLMVYLRLDVMSPLLGVVSLLGGKSSASEKVHPSQKKASENGEQALPTGGASKKHVVAHGIRLLELTERGSSVMAVTEAETYNFLDPVLSAFRLLGQFYNLGTSGEVSVVPENAYSSTLLQRARDQVPDLLLLPWSRTGSMSETTDVSVGTNTDTLYTSSVYATFMDKTLAESQCTTAVFVTHAKNEPRSPREKLQRRPSTLSIQSRRDHTPTTTPPSAPRSYHIFMPFFGGRDGRATLRLVLQLAETENVTATIVHFETQGAQAVTNAASSTDGEIEPTVIVEESSKMSKTIARVVTSAVMKTKRGKGPVISLTAIRSDSATFFALMQRSLPADLIDRVAFETVDVSASNADEDDSDPLTEALSRATTEFALLRPEDKAGAMVVLGRNQDLFVSEEASVGCLGVAAQAFIGSNLGANVLVVKAKHD